MKEKSLARSKCRWGDDNKMGLKETGYKYVGVELTGSG
jgi:hypothetical protein